MSMSSTTPVPATTTRPILAFLSSSIGKKLIVALTGIAMILFLMGHLAGNLLVFVGPEAINTYGVKLRELGPLLWLARAALVAILVAHIVATISLRRENRRARPDKYAVHKRQRSTLFARTMLVSGLIVFAFLIFHLAQFTFQITDPAYQKMYDADGRHDIYTMVITAFANPVTSGFYILALGLVAFHLSHGFASVFQTLGITNRRMKRIYETVALIFAWVLFAGYVSIPIAVLTGFLSINS